MIHGQRNIKLFRYLFLTCIAHSYAVLPLCLCAFLYVYIVHFILEHTFYSHFVKESIVTCEIT